MLSALWRIVVWTLTIGGICFAAGFFGPMIFAPGANQGPLLGILITGPLGAIAGFALGIVRELLGYPASPMQVFARTGLLDLDRHQIMRPTAAVTGVVLVLYGLGGIRRGEGRPAAAGLVVGGAMLWYAAVGEVPEWFRR